jgi:quinol monooxygenase YgiN
MNFNISSMSPEVIKALIAGIGIGAILGGSIGSAIVSKGVNRRIVVVDNDVDMFVLMVAINFKTERDEKVFEGIFLPFAEWVDKNEHNTLAYEIMYSDRHHNQVLLFEKYRTKADYEAHRLTKEFMDFRQKLKGLEHSYTMTGESYKYHKVPHPNP